MINRTFGKLGLSKLPSEDKLNLVQMDRSTKTIKRLTETLKKMKSVTMKRFQSENRNKVKFSSICIAYSNYQKSTKRNRNRVNNFENKNSVTTQKCQLNFCQKRLGWYLRRENEIASRDESIFLAHFVIFGLSEFCNKFYRKKLFQQFFLVQSSFRFRPSWMKSNL